MWKGGVHWLVADGVECMVRFETHQGIAKGVVVITRSYKETMEQCVKVFDKIIKCVKDTQERLCNSIRPECFLLDSFEAASTLSEESL